MERDKIDKTWKERLAEREITPSTQAWDKLSFQLDQHNKTNNKQKYRLFLYIAACLVLGGYLVAQFVWQEQSVVAPTVLDNLPTQTVVDGNVNNKKNEEAKEQVEVVTQQGVPEKVIRPTAIAKAEHLKQAIVKHETIAPALEETKVIASKEIELADLHVAPSKGVVVNSTDLLKQVEGEIVIEYREAVVKKIYDKTKKVVVEFSNSRYEK